VFAGDELAALDAAAIDKSFGASRVLHGVGVRIAPGEVHALLGENGAGKSTLIRIIAGVLQPDAGTVKVGDSVGPFANPHDAERNGVATVHQELAVVPGLSVAENVMLGHGTPQRAGFVRWATLRRGVRDIFDRLDVAIDVRRDAATLSPIERTMTLLARALSVEARLLILDEPTASLTDVERATLFAAIRRAARLGVGVLYVSHRLDEVFEIADMYTVLRNGEVVATGTIAGTSAGDVITAMTGRSIDAVFPDQNPPSGVPMLTVRDLAGRRIRGVSLDVGRGEIVGVAGLAGSGRSELLRIIGGVQPRGAGRVVLYGDELRLGRPRQGQRRGVVYIPQERHSAGLIPDTAERNLNATTIGQHAAFGPFVSTTAERRHAGRLWSRFGVRGAGLDQPVLDLSGGNQQKVMLAKFLALEPSVVLLDDPTHGVDVGTKVEIYRTISDLAAGGAAVLIVSSELLELVGLCHRVVVLHEGRKVAQFTRDEFDEGRILSACFGQEASRGCD
jgi:ABC-type sugar transport system ATPase subunit